VFGEEQIPGEGDGQEVSERGGSENKMQADGRTVCIALHFLCVSIRERPRKGVQRCPKRGLRKRRQRLRQIKAEKRGEKSCSR